MQEPLAGQGQLVSNLGNLSTHSGKLKVMICLPGPNTNASCFNRVAAGNHRHSSSVERTPSFRASFPYAVLLGYRPKGKVKYLCGGRHPH
jgi:hypothetical protein